MRKKIVEGSVLFISILKWLFLAACICIIVGISTTIFLNVLGFSISTTASHPYYYLLLPAALFVSALVVKVFAPDAEGHGTEKIIEAVHRHSGKMKLAVVPVKLVATIITIAWVMCIPSLTKARQHEVWPSCCCPREQRKLRWSSNIFRLRRDIRSAQLSGNCRTGKGWWKSKTA